ncbi:MAG TPA: ATPase, T2SS/T4P/T4SS family, partial [Anaerolineae bacterium]|nr:ATPase, T2SS/T4P/T4SS family [Anaerolineae bacterium]
MSLIDRLKRDTREEIKAKRDSKQPSLERVPDEVRLNTRVRHTVSSDKIRQKAPSYKNDQYKALRERIQEKLVAELDPSIDVTQTEEVRRTILDMYDQLLSQENIILSRAERERMFEAIAAEILGFGPLEPLLADETVSEIMVNGPDKVYVERKGKLSKTPVIFEDNAHVLKVIDRIVSPLGRRIDESSPMVDARLPDGSRVNAIIPPLSLNGPTLTIRKF